MTSAAPPLLQASAAIFDVDGTLVDSVDLHADAWRRAFAAFGFHFDVTDVRQQIGKGGDQLMPVFLDPETLNKIGERIEAYRQDLFKREYLHRVRGFPRSRELFEFLLGKGKKIALGSSAKATDLPVYKQAARIDGLAVLDTTSDDAERSKPHADIFVAALERLGLPSSRVVVVGDSPYDAEAALKAGMKTTGLLCGGFSETSLRQAGVVDIYRDPADLLAALQGREDAMISAC